VEYCLKKGEHGGHGKKTRTGDGPPLGTRKRIPREQEGGGSLGKTHGDTFSTAGRESGILHHGARKLISQGDSALIWGGKALRELRARIIL